MDVIVPEPLGGAHSDPVSAFPAIKDAIMGTFREYEHKSEREIQLDRWGKCIRVCVARGSALGAGCSGVRGKRRRGAGRYR